MRPGERVDRWQVMAAARGEATVARWRVADDAGQPGELLELRPEASAGPATEAAFLAVHRTVAAARDPALVRVLGTGTHGGRAWVVHAPLEDPTLADVTGTLTPAEVAGVGARLLPAVVAAGSATGGALRAEDVGIDATGGPILAPRGRPGTHVEPDALRWVAPEALDGAPPDGAAGLYGLGVALYRLLTGRDPLPGGVRPGAQRPVPASAWRADVPEVLDRALGLLLSDTPEDRATALPLLHELAGALPDLRARLAGDRNKPPSAVAGEVRVTRSADAPSRGRADVRAPTEAVIVPASALARLDPAGRSAAAGSARVPVATVEALVAEGLPLVLHLGASPGPLSPGARRVRSPSAWILPTAAVLQGLAAAFFLVPAVILAPAMLLLTALFLGSASVTLAAWWQARMAWIGVLAAHGAQTRTSSAPEVARLQERLAGVRVRLGATELPTAAELDLREALREVEAQLLELGTVADALDAALGTVDVQRLRARLAGLAGRTDAEAEAERLRVGRALADLDAVRARRAEWEAELVQIDDALSEVAAVLGGAVAQRGGRVAAEDLARVTRLARAAVEEAARR